MSSLITLIKNNFDLIKSGNINDIKHIIPSNNIKEKFSSINILSFQNLLDLYDELININSTLKNNINSYGNITIRNLKELKDKNRRYEIEINNLKNELNIIQKSQNEIEEKSKQNDMQLELKTNKLKENNEKLEIQLNSISSLINESYKKITKEYNIISTTEEFPENLKIPNFQNNNIKEMIMDYEKILNNLTQYTKILINDKKRLFKLGEKSDECEKDLLLIKQELEDLKQNNFQNINISKSNNDTNSKDEEIISLTKKLNEKTEDFEKLNSNYNLLYTQYHTLLAKENLKNPKNRSLPSQNIFHY
jgi:chromosome segregation ATPase